MYVHTYVCDGERVCNLHAKTKFTVNAVNLFLRVYMPMSLLENEQYYDYTHTHTYTEPYIATQSHM